jgi:hypothetical protein
MIGILLLTCAHASFADTHEAAEPRAASVEVKAPFESLPDAPLPHLVSAAGITGVWPTGEASNNLAIESSMERPAPALAETSGSAVTVQRELTREQLTEGCETGRIRGNPCKVNWRPILWQSFEWLTAQHSGNILLD